MTVGQPPRIVIRSSRRASTGGPSGRFLAAVVAVTVVLGLLERGAASSLLFDTSDKFTGRAVFAAIFFALFVLTSQTAIGWLRRSGRDLLRPPADIGVAVGAAWAVTAIFAIVQVVAVLAAADAAEAGVGLWYWGMQAALVAWGGYQGMSNAGTLSRGRASGGPAGTTAGPVRPRRRGKPMTISVGPPGGTNGTLKKMVCPACREPFTAAELGDSSALSRCRRSAHHVVHRDCRSLVRSRCPVCKGGLR